METNNANEDETEVGGAVSRFVRFDKTMRLMIPPASRGGSRGYSLEVRIEQLHNFYTGRPIRVSRSSISRWERRIIPKKMSGGPATPVMSGRDQFLLVLGLSIWPDLSLREMATFIFGEGGNLYSDLVISRRLSALNITRKKPSREAKEAQTPENRDKVIIFWTSMPPLGVVGVLRQQLLDVDEFSVSLKRTNRYMAWALKFERVRIPGLYRRSGAVFTVLLAIEPGNPGIPAHLPGSLENPGRWVNVIRNQGVTSDIFAQFVQTIQISIETRNILLLNEGVQVDWRRYFLWDNLASHHSMAVLNAMEGHPGRVEFSSIPRPPYQPKYGPIEYKICDLIHECKVNSRLEWDDDSLEQAVYSAVQKINGFDATFEHCGYSIDGRNSFLDDL